MVTFEAAKVENANDPQKVMESMKRSRRISGEMTLEHFVNEGYYAELRGEYVFKRVQSRYTQTKRLLQKILPKGTIIESIAISNLFLLKNTPGTYALLKERGDIIEINTNQKFTVDLDRTDNSHTRLVPRAGQGRLKRMLDLSVNPDVQWNVAKIGADRVWNHGNRGEGIIYGIADTGVSFTHPVLTKNYRGLKGDNTFDHNYAWWDGVREKVPMAPASSCPVSSRQPCDDQGHGTHCLSTAAGLGGFGVAPGVKWVGCRNMDAGLGSTVTYLSCLNFFLAPHDLDVRSKQSLVIFFELTITIFREITRNRQ